MLESFPDLCVTSVAASVAFYRSLLGLDVIVDHGWYAEMGMHGRTLIAFVASGHETIPAASGAAPRGVLVSFEVDDAAEVAAAADRLGAVALVELVVELGQHHFMLADPDGAVVDIIERVPLTPDDVRRLARYRRRASSLSA